MKISKIKPILTDRYLLIRVYTDVGITGNGEAGCWAHHSMVAEAIREFSNYFIGKDPRSIEHHHQVLTRQTHFMGAVISSALSAIDIALWDILGKSVNLPVYQLLGGKCREKVRVFNNVTGDTYEDRAASAKKAVANGFTSLRMTPFFPGFEKRSSTDVITTTVEMVATVRESVGNSIDLGLEIHRNLKPDEAITLAQELRPFKLKYYEDPLAPECNDALEYIAQHINIPMAVGERSYNIFQFKELVDKKIAAFIRPDISLAGGFTEVKKVAGIAESAFIQVFPHLMGSPVNNAAFTHFAAVIPNYYVMEVNTHTDNQLALVDSPYQVIDGYRQLSDRPGIGVEIDEEQCEKTPFVSHQITDNIHADGSVTL